MLTLTLDVLRGKYSQAYIKALLIRDILTTYMYDIEATCLFSKPL